MTTFDDRQKSMEKKFAMEEEKAFKMKARKHKLVGLWAAEKIGKTDEEAEAYAKEVVLADFEVPGDSDVIEKLIRDLSAAGIEVTEKDIRVEMSRAEEEARRQIEGESK